MPDGMSPDDRLRAAGAVFSEWSGTPDAVGAGHFRPLGHNRGRFYFLTSEGRQVVDMRVRDLHSDSELIALAPRQWWEINYSSKTGIDTKQAGDALVRASYAVGVYDPAKLRGRGVWLDAGRTVVHLGDHLLVNGVATALPDMASAFIYEQARALPIDLGEPLTDAEGLAFLEMCCRVAWENPERDGRLLAGWIPAAMVCGALRWRPHLWLASEAGGGKSWVLDNIVKPILRDLSIQVQSKTTEAGIRGALGSDALSVLFDEAETQNDRDRDRIQHVLDLARQASSEDGGAIIKGTQDGGSRSYHVRGCFVFSSINLGLSQAADESRTVVLSIGTGSPEQFGELKRQHSAAMPPGFAGRLFARVLAMVPTIRANAETLADAIARTGAGRRAGDTLGAVLAGAMALTTSRVLSAEDADKVVADREWIAAAAKEAKPEAEWRRALTMLMQAEAMATSTNGRREGLTVAELVAAAAGRTDDGIGINDADAQLRRMLMRVHGGCLLIGNGSEAVKRIFAASAWATAWSTTIARAPGVERGKEVRFLPTAKAKSISIPLSLIGCDDADF